MASLLRSFRRYMLVLFPVAIVVVNNFKVFLAISDNSLARRSLLSSIGPDELMLHVSSASKAHDEGPVVAATLFQIQQASIPQPNATSISPARQALREVVSAKVKVASRTTRRRQPMVSSLTSPIRNSSWPMQWSRFKHMHSAWPVPGNAVHICYMHTGKTGGQTLENKIPIAMPRKRRSLSCLIQSVNASLGLEDALDLCDPRRKNETAIAKHIVSYFHLSAPSFTPLEREWSLKLTNTLLFTIRNPIDRIVSAFHFHHNKRYQKLRREYREQDAGAIFFQDCFPNASLSTAIQALQARPHPISELCRTTSHFAFQGYVSPRMLHPSQRKFPHFFYNYQWYLERYFKMDATPDVVVIRTSHLWEDATALDRTLGGGDIPFRQPGTAYTHGSETFRKNSDDVLTQDHFTTLCCILHRDLQAYQWIVRMARNLSQEVKEETILELMRTCGVEKSARDESGATDVLSYLWEDWYQATCPNLLWRNAV